MTANAESLKRLSDQVDRDVILMANQHETNEQAKKKRRVFEFESMTQYTSTNAESQTHTNDEHTIEGSPSGYIKKVILKRFMCHEHFELELGPRLNFIVGNNGSGKSAILTAITIGLGAKASETNRGTSLKDLIKEGCNSSKISLHLQNSLYGSYKPELYGNVIIIERTIKKEGTATFSLKSENGKEISNKKKDLQSIVDFFSVPVTNPMCFLSQDAARSFLTASTASDKYNHFMKGTLLQEISDNLDHAKEMHTKAQVNMSLHAENLKRLKVDYIEAKKLVQRLSETGNLSERKKFLQGKSLWIDVEHNTESLNKLNEEIERYKSKVKDEKERIRIKNEKILRYSTDRESIEKDIESKVLEINEKNTSYQEAKLAIDEMKAAYEVEKSNKKEAENSLNSARSNLTSLKKIIERIEEELRREMGGEKDEMRNELQKLEKENERNENVINSLSFQLQELQTKEQNIIRERNAEVKAQEYSIQSTRNEMNKQSQGENNFLSNFDDKMPYLLQMIKQNEKKFHSAPIGPLGAYVSVKSDYQKWIRPIQKAIASTLNAFVVQNQHDNRLLRNLIKASGVKANITVFTYKLGNFDYSQGKAKSQFPTLVDVLSFSKNEIQSLFVDQNKIEKVLLIEDKDQARTFLKSRPSNVAMALSLRNHDSGFQLTGGYRIDTVTYQRNIWIKLENNLHFLKGLIQDETKELELLKERYADRISVLQNEIRQVDADYRELRQQLNKNRDKMSSLKLSINKVVDTGTLTARQAEKVEQERAITSYEAIISTLTQKMSDIATESQPLKEKLDATKQSLMNCQTDLRNLKDEMNLRVGKVSKYKEDIKHSEEKITSISSVISRKEENVNTLRQGIDEQILRASQFCSKADLDKLNLPNTQEEIKIELKNISNLIRRSEANLGFTQEQVLEHFEVAKSKLKEGQEKFVTIDKALESLYRSIHVRLQNLQQSQRSTCVDADLDFRASLRLRNFAGNLVFNADAKQLVINIRTANDEKGRNVDTLSGGEKSFSQMALLLATWKSMRSRIIALDEFDVFMDQVNRKIGTELIVKKLKDLARTQTIIITPQDIGKITDIDSSGIRIHKMKDPQR